MSFFIQDALAQAGQAGNQSTFSLIFLVGLVVVFYMFLIRPQTKKQKEHQQMISGLGKGDEAVTQGGLAGRIVELGDNFILLEIADNVQVKVQKHMVSVVLVKGTIKKM